MTNKLAKQLGITLKPFCVRIEDLTPQLVQDLLDRAVSLGANACECFAKDGNIFLVRKYEYKYRDYSFDNWGVVGVDSDMDTFLTDLDDVHNFNHNILSFLEMCDYLQVHQEGDRLVANEDLAEEEPNLWDTPSAQEVDEDGFTPWDGEGDLPFNIGEKVYVKLDSGEEYMITHGGTRGNNLWYKRGDGPTIVKYKAVPTYTAPVSPVERSSVFDSVEVGSNLERALELVLAVYNGDEVSFNREGYNRNTRVDDVVTYLLDVMRVVGSENNYTLKSELEANIRNEEKVMLDREIKGLENWLQQLKDERKELGE